MSFTRSEFFEHVLPPVGHICLVGLWAHKKGDVVSDFHPIEDVYNGVLDARIDQLVADKREVYFGCATFKDPADQRTARNAVGYKCFRIDIDCGPGKDYADQREGLKALQEYLLAIGLPTPTLVSSGRGWHGYWALDEVINYNTWKFIADALKASMRALNFNVDASVTADGARILRIPETFNNKDSDNPKAVKIVKMSDTVDLEYLKERLGDYLIGTPIVDKPLGYEGVSAADDPLMAKLLASSEKKFSKVLKLSLEEKEVTESVEVTTEKDGVKTTKTVKQKVTRSAGCAQIAYIYRDQSNPAFPYDLWRAGISIAANCSDADTAIHDISRGYPEYDELSTIRLAEGTKDKPQLCQTFQSLNPELCVTCPLKQTGKIKTPIQLGMSLVAATPLDNIQEDIWHQDLNERVDVEIPSQYPKPWFRPKKGGVAKISIGDDGEEGASDNTGDMLVYPNDLWVKKRRLDPDPRVGSMVQIVRILPIDGMSEFTIPLAYITKRDRLIEALSINGVAVQIPMLAHIQRYIIDWVQFLESKEPEEKAREQFGWQDKDKSFLIGTREIKRDGTVIYSPPCSTTHLIAEHYVSKGTIDNWRKIADVLNKPGNEARAFVLFASMGSPLYKFAGEGSMLLHLMNAASGTGKSTAQKIAASVWGHPVGTMLNENDTVLSQQQRASVLGNITLVVDEITNMSGAEISDFTYRFSFNRARNRMQAQSNAERKNTATWSMPAITSGNNSLYDTLKSFKAITQGENFRILELHIERDDSITTEESEHLFNELLSENFGLVGEDLMKYVVPNLEDVKKRRKELSNQFKAMANFGPRERMYTALCASAFTMAEIGFNLGLHGIDVPRVMRWAAQTFGKIAHDVVNTVAEEKSDILGQFFLEFARSVLTVNNGGDSVDAKLRQEPTRVPYGELVIRYEPDTRMVYVAKAKLQSWCALRRIPMSSMLDNLKAEGVFAGDFKLCLSRGTTLPGASVWAIGFYADRLGWNLDNEPLVPID